jgi:hypothetical protein
LSFVGGEEPLSEKLNDCNVAKQATIATLRVVVA